jgi:hypothetical protein
MWLAMVRKPHEATAWFVARAGTAQNASAGDVSGDSEPGPGPSAIGADIQRHITRRDEVPEHAYFGLEVLTINFD